jgi:hypothetical protein
MNYRQQILQCLRQLARRSQELPLSFFLRNITRVECDSVQTGGSAVRSAIDQSYSTADSVHEGRLSGRTERELCLSQGSACTKTRYN